MKRFPRNRFEVRTHVLAKYAVLINVKYVTSAMLRIAIRTSGSCGYCGIMRWGCFSGWAVILPPFDAWPIRTIIKLSPDRLALATSWIHFNTSFRIAMDAWYGVELAMSYYSPLSLRISVLSISEISMLLNYILKRSNGKIISRNPTTLNAVNSVDMA